MGGINSGQPKRTTNQPTTLRLLKAVAHQEVTLTKVVVGHQVQWHLTPLPDLILKILRHLGLSPTVYTRLVDNSGEWLRNYTKDEVKDSLGLPNLLSPFVAGLE